MIVKTIIILLHKKTKKTKTKLTDEVLLMCTHEIQYISLLWRCIINIHCDCVFSVYTSINWVSSWRFDEIENEWTMSSLYVIIIPLTVIFYAVINFQLLKILNNHIIDISIIISIWLSRKRNILWRKLFHSSLRVDKISELFFIQAVVVVAVVVGGGSSVVINCVFTDIFLHNNSNTIWSIQMRQIINQWWRSFVCVEALKVRTIWGCDRLTITTKRRNHWNRSSTIYNINEQQEY